MSFDYSTLIIDRAASDSDALRALVKKPMSQWTAAEAEAFRAATLKGSYDYTDLNRVSACMEDLVARLNGLGYAVPGYERVKIQRTGKPAGRLPEGYMEVEYIQSSGTQWVDSGVLPNQDSRVICKFQFLLRTEEQTMFMGRTAANENAFGLFHNKNGWNFDYGTGRATGATATAITDVVDLDCNKSTATLNGSELINSAQSWAGTASLAIFARNTNGTLNNYATAKLWSFSIFANGTIIRDFVPCINADTVAGLYDLVSSQFYGNAGTGSFSAGPTVEVETDTPSDSDALDPYLWYPEDAPTRPRIEQYRGNVAAVRAVLAMPDTMPEVPESLRKPTTDEVNTIEAILVAIDLILTHIPAARRHCGVTVCGLRGVIA